MEKDYPWYSLVDGAETILQGDFIHECPVLILPAEFSVGDEIEVSVVNYNVVVMSQSCDLVQGKIDLVLVCPVWPLSEFENRSDFFKSKRGKEALRQGNVPGYHLLNKCEIEGFQQNYLVVDFRSVYGIPFNFLFQLVQKKGKRLRLLSPYREHLSQAFARFFMRVGLPVDIPPFK